MKKFPAVIFILTLLFFLSACDGLFGTDDKQPENQGNITINPSAPSSKNFSKDFWGEWIRMDTGDEWYITSNSIKVKGQNSSTDVLLAKQSSRVIEITDGSRKYYLFASRPATSSFRGKVVGDGTGAMNRAIGSSLGGINITISNLNDKVEATTVTTDGSGNFEADGIIIGDDYEIKTEGQTTIVSPNANGEDIGTITVTGGVNFKTSVRPKDTKLDMNRLYANLNSYTFNIEIENTGIEDCTAATYSLNLDSDLVHNSGSLSGILGTIEPNRKKTIELAISCKAIQNEYEFKRIRININDPISGKSWDDSVSIKFNKASVDFNIRSNAPVSGVIITPNAKAYPFNTGGYNYYSDYSASLTMPWSSKDYLVVFSGATADTEAVYSLGINVIPDTNFSDFLDVGNYEPNNTEATATQIYMQDKIMSYLHKNDIDYFKINLGTAAPDIIPVSITDYAIKESIGNDDGKANPHETLYLDIRVKNNINSTINISSVALSTTSDYVTIKSENASIGNLSAGYYKTLTDNSYGYSYENGVKLLYANLSTKAFMFTISGDCPVGTDLPFTVTFTDSWGNVWTDTITIPVVGTGAIIAIPTPVDGNFAIREAANGNDDGKANPHETHYLDIRVRNSGTSDALGLMAVLTTTSSYVTIDSGNTTIGNLSTGYYKTLTDNSNGYSYENGVKLLYANLSTKAFRFTIANDCPVGIDLPFTVTFTDSWGNEWIDTITIPVVATGAKIAINTPVASNFSIRNTTSSVIDQAKPNSSQYLDIRVKNSGTSDALGLMAVLTTTSSYVTIDSGSATIGNLNAGYYKTLTDNSYGYSYENGVKLLYANLSTKAFMFTISSGCPVGIDLPFTVTFTDSWGNTWTDALTITVQ